MATPEGVRGELVNKAGLARIAGRPVKTVDDWIRRGLPAVERGDRGRQWKFDTAAAIDWITEQRAGYASTAAREPDQTVLDLNEQRARESKERADKYALENAVKRRELVPVEEVVEHWGKMIAAAKRQLRSIPTRLKGAGIIPDMTPAQHSAALELVDEALSELAGSGVPDGDGAPLDEDGARLDAAAAPNAI